MFLAIWDVLTSLSGLHSPVAASIVFYAWASLAYLLHYFILSLTLFYFILLRYFMHGPACHQAYVWAHKKQGKCACCKQALFLVNALTHSCILYCRWLISRLPTPSSLRLQWFFYWWVLHADVLALCITFLYFCRSSQCGSMTGVSCEATLYLRTYFAPSKTTSATRKPSCFRITFCIKPALSPCKTSVVDVAGQGHHSGILPAPALNGMWC